MRHPKALVAGAILPFLLSRAPAAAHAAPPSNPRAELATLDADAAHRSVLARPLRAARDALARAQNMERAGDARHAVAARALATRWLEAAATLVRAAEAEARATAAERSLDEVETKLVRGRSLLEATVARRGRAQVALEALDSGGAAPTAPAGADAKKPASPGGAAASPPVAPAPRPAVPVPAPATGARPAETGR